MNGEMGYNSVQARYSKKYSSSTSWVAQARYSKGIRNPHREFWVRVSAIPLCASYLLPTVYASLWRTFEIVFLQMMYYRLFFYCCFSRCRCLGSTAASRHIGGAVYVVALPPEVHEGNVSLMVGFQKLKTSIALLPRLFAGSSVALFYTSYIIGYLKSESDR